MTLSKNELIRLLSKDLLNWSCSLRDTHFKTSEAIPTQEKLKFAPYFEPSILKNTKIKFVDSVDLPILNESIREAVLSRYFNLFDLAGITFWNCILLIPDNMNKKLNFSSLLFHELVHVVQYNLLGMEKYIALYTSDWVNSGYKYESIALESIAHKLTLRFEQGLVFSVKQCLSDEVDLKKIWQ